MPLLPGAKPTGPDTRNASSDTAKPLSPTRDQNRPVGITPSRNEAALRRFAKVMGMFLGGWLAWRAALSMRTWGEGVETVVALIYVPLGATVGVGVGSLLFHLMKALWQKSQRSR